MTGALVAGLLAGYGVAVPVGPVAAYLVVLGAQVSSRAGVAAALGVATADGLYALLAGLGGRTLSAALHDVAAPLRRVSAGVLLVLAVRLAVRAAREHRSVAQPGPAAKDADQAPALAYRHLLLVTALNPATLGYLTALVVALPPAASAAAGPAVFAAAAFAASASWQVLLVTGGRLLGRAVTGRRGRLATSSVSAAVVAVLAVRLALQG